MEGTGQAAAIEESILAAAKIMVNILAESLLREGVEQITVPQFRILDMVQSLSDKPADMARMLGVSPPAISSMLERLEEKGLIKRSFSTRDRRRVEIVLTGEGSELVKRVNARRKAYLGKVLQGMEGGKRTGFEEALQDFSRSYLRLKEKGG